MQLYGRGLRRRLPPMLGGDERRIRLAYSLMFGLPGTPALFYGEEIGMGEQLALEGRMAVRTPMQWQPGAGGGFSHAEQPCRPFPEGAYAPDSVSVQAQRHDAGLAARLDARADPVLPRVPRARRGATRACSSTRSRRCSRSAATGRTGRSCRPTI